MLAEKQSTAWTEIPPAAQGPSEAVFLGFQGQALPEQGAGAQGPT